jgi:uncharacterized protein with von Willebrand factor type A (vWA) domain
MSEKNKNQVVVKDAFDRLAFEGISHATALGDSVAADADATEDTFAAFYKLNVETQGDSTRKQIIDQMLSLPEYQTLHEATQLDDISSALASAEFSKNLIDQISKIEQKTEQAKQDGQPSDLENVLGEKGLGALRATLRRSLEQAEQKAEDWAEVKTGWGIEKGDLSEMSGPDRMALAERIMTSSKLKRISALIGRFRNIVNAASTMIYSHGNDEIIDITTGNDLSRLLPTELVKLSISPAEFYRGYLEGSLQQYNLKGQEPKGKGPIIVALDVSGSMFGWAEDYARALTMALCQLASKEKRAFSVIFFDGKVQDVRTWEKGSKISLSDRLALVNRASDGGGTDFVAPLSKAMEIRSKLNPELKPADLVFITDGDCVLPEDFASEFEFAKKKTDLRVYGLAVGSPRTLTFCESVYQIGNQGHIEEVKEMIRKAATRK